MDGWDGWAVGSEQYVVNGARYRWVGPGWSVRRRLMILDQLPAPPRWCGRWTGAIALRCIVPLFSRDDVKQKDRMPSQNQLKWLFFVEGIVDEQQ